MPNQQIKVDESNDVELFLKTEIIKNIMKKQKKIVDTNYEYTNLDGRTL
jgi:hypothetical protein